MPRFSVVVPTKDRPEWLARCVESVLAQDFDDFEVIIYDNGQIEPVLPDDDRIRYERGSASGPADAYQRGLDLATGEIVTPLADDDAMTPHALRIVDTAIGDVEWLNAKTQIVDTDGKVMHVLGGTPSDLEALPESFRLGGANFWRPSLTDRVGGFDPEYEGAADYDLYARFAVECSPVLVDEVLYIYTEHPDTDSKRNGNRQLEAAARVKQRWQ